MKQVAEVGVTLAAIYWCSVAAFSRAVIFKNATVDRIARHAAVVGLFGAALVCLWLIS